MKKKWELVKKFLTLFLQDEVNKTGLKKVVLGLSGGLDSAVVAILAKDAFGENLRAVIMPSQFSSQKNIDDAKSLCEKFNILYELVEIAPLLNSYFSDYSNKLRVGNFSARVRMSILFDISARDGALVLGTSNKSELMLGYGTIFGDLASAINPIGDIYKSELFEFAKFLNVPDEIINKAPSADLFEGQSDEADLGFSYYEIDRVLIEFVDNRLNESELRALGFNSNLIDMVIERVYKNQFKRKMPLIAKLTNRTVTHDFLYPRDIKL